MRSRPARAFAVAALATLAFGCAAKRGPLAPSTPTAAPIPVSCRPELTEPTKPDPGRTRICVVDIGSRNVKLVIASLEEKNPRSYREERVCRARMGLGEKTFDNVSQRPRPLQAPDQDTLARLLVDYAKQCERDGGRVLGAVATEWARRATNAEEVQKAIQARVGLGVEILSRDREGRFGYLAATKGAQGRMVVDFGSRSFQLTWWPRGAAAPQTASLPLGIDEVGDRFFSRTAYGNYRAARLAYQGTLREALKPALAKMRSDLRRGTLGPELLSLAENGDMALAVERKLWDRDTRRGVDEGGYGALIKARTPTDTAEYGPVNSVMRASLLVALARAVESDDALFQELRSDRLKRIWGYKMLAYPAMLALLVEELGLRTVVLVPHEMPAGLVVDQLKANLAAAK